MTVSTINTNTVELRTPANAVVPATVTYSGVTATLTPSSPLSANTTYTARVIGGTTDPRVKDLAGNALATTYQWTFTTGAAAPVITTIWSNAVVPATPSVSETDALELGVKFRSDVAGYIRGIRFYKGANNTGTHTGSLWSSAGSRLATATFGTETATGWQQVLFTTPIQIAANTTYIASYYAPQGGFAVNLNYFTNGGADSGVLHALSNTAAGGNGVFIYGGPNQFPVNTWSSSNYWVDVLFSTTP